MLLTLGLHKNSLVRSYREHRILTPKIPKQSGKTVVTILVTTVSIFRMVLSASRRLPCGERPDGAFLVLRLFGCAESEQTNMSKRCRPQRSALFYCAVFYDLISFRRRFVSAGDEKDVKSELLITAAESFFFFGDRASGDRGGFFDSV